MLAMSKIKLTFIILTFIMTNTNISFSYGSLNYKKNSGIKLRGEIHLNDNTKYCIYGIDMKSIVVRQSGRFVCLSYIKKGSVLPNKTIIISD